MPLLKDYEKIKMFVKKVFDLATEMKIPILDERTLSDVKVNTGALCWSIRMKVQPEDDGPIKAFLALAQYFKSIIIKKGDAFYIPHGSESYKLESVS
ncbi:MAG: hypothetical protein ACTSYQ_03780 [Candidatus Odinarchaeia archaeon]